MSSTALLGSKLVEVMPPSVQKVYRTLQSGKRMHVGDIESRTNYSPRTVRQALRLLKQADLIAQIPDMFDMRRHYFVAVGA